MTLVELSAQAKDLPKTARMPLLFIGHGSPMNAIEDNVFSQGWKKLGVELSRPRAILAISAHWLTEGTFVHTAIKPKTIHDFYGFPKSLYDINYSCAGSPGYAAEAKALLMRANAQDDLTWGIDHGTWVVLHRMYPAADIPVFQLSIDFTKPAAYHYQIGKELALLRKRGILIMGSGNLVHNLGQIDFNENAPEFDWAREFDERATTLIKHHDHTALINYERLGNAALLSIPTPDHYWPLLYILGLQEDDEGVEFPIEGITHGSISMRSLLIR